MVDAWYPDQFLEHTINYACSSETGQSVEYNGHFKHQQVEDIHITDVLGRGRLFTILARHHTGCNTPYYKNHKLLPNLQLSFNGRAK
jgi:hypothetical protein